MTAVQPYLSHPKVVMIKWSLRLTRGAHIPQCLGWDFGAKFKVMSNTYFTRIWPTLANLYRSAGMVTLLYFYFVALPKIKR